MLKNNEELTEQDMVYGLESEFCVYEGPKDDLNYWRYFRLIVEDYSMLRFYQIIDHQENGIVRNKVTCYDLGYNF